MPGEVFRNPDMSRVLRELGQHGAQKGFYQNATGQAIIKSIAKHGGCMSQEDLASHTSSFPDPICAQYRDHTLWQCPPNGQGVSALIALTGLDHLEKNAVLPKYTQESVGSGDFYHGLIEMMRLGFADCRAFVADENSMQVGNAFLLDRKRIGNRAMSLFDKEKAKVAGLPDASSNTISFQVVDNDGNAISFVNSNFMGFGTGIVPTGCGFTLQNRGFGFTLTTDHPNALAPSKRPYHTIIPALLTHTDTSELYATLTNMGGNMQPQGHLQLTVGLLAGLDPQSAIDQPRFCIADGTQNGKVFMEAGIDENVLVDLRSRGHILHENVDGMGRVVFGRAQIIVKNRDTGVLWAGSDGRADGCAMGF